MVTHKALVLTQEALATIAYRYAPLLSGLFDEVHQAFEALIAQLKFRIPGCTTDREDGKQPPALQSERDEIVLEFLQAFVVSVVDTGDNIEFDCRFAGQNPYCLRCILEAALNTPHPFVLLLKSVKTDCGRVHS